jgi:hypothetical protein
MQHLLTFCSLSQQKNALPSLAINRQGLTSARRAPSARGAVDKSGKAPAANAETISDLPQPSGRITDCNTAGTSNRQRSARGRPKSGRSISSDGERSDSETGTEEVRTATTAAKPSSLFSANPYAAPTQNKAKVQSSSGPDDAYTSLDQVIEVRQRYGRDMV